MAWSQEKCRIVLTGGVRPHAVRKRTQIDVAAVVGWAVKDTAQAAFDVDDFQSVAAEQTVE